MRPFSSRPATLPLLALLASASAAHADDGACSRAVEVRFAPVGGAQIAAWIESASGHVVETLFVTRSTGLLGLGNRPGHPRLRSDYRFPYGSREMVLPVWAWRREKLYQKVVMGGAGGFESNDTIGYHFPASSPETFYCGPQGAIHHDIEGVDAVSCASPFYGLKGRYQPGAFSHYPPRADLVSFNPHDAEDTRAFAADNDLAAVSGATPPAGRQLDPPLRWMPGPGMPDGAYVARVEVSREADFNKDWPACTGDDPHCAHPTQLDEDSELRAYGHEILGQPSIVWSVPLLVDGKTRVTLGSGYEGYGSWDGSSGALHPPDATISDTVPGSGAQRLLVQHDDDGAWQVKVTSIGCDGGCVTPGAVGALDLVPSASGMTVHFTAPSGLARPARYEVRYAAGPLTEATFASGIPGDQPPAPGPPGHLETLLLTGLKPEITYTVGVRALAACRKASPVRFASTATGSATYAVLHGCFVATAAWGSPLVAEVDALRRLRDRHLVTTPLGRLFVGAYYALGPSLASAVATDERFRAAARAALAPLVRVARAAAP